MNFKMKKDVIVLVADKNYINHAKSLFQNIIDNGKWKDDLCLITTNDIDQNDISLFKNKKIDILTINYNNTTYNKILYF